MNIVYEKSFLRDIKKVKDKTLLNDLSKILNDLKTVNEISQFLNIKKLKGHTTAFRVRIGDFRLGFFFENNTIIVTRFLNRKDIYKLFP
jgi:mRNA interferase RelE/StbE